MYFFVFPRTKNFYITIGHPLKIIDKNDDSYVLV